MVQDCVVSAQDMPQDIVEFGEFGLLEIVLQAFSTVYLAVNV